MLTDNELINRCLLKDPRAQELLYRRFAPKMYGVCLRYAGNEGEAEDILQEGFIRIFNNLQHYRFEGALAGWVHRTMINTAINHYHKNLKFRKESELNENLLVATIHPDALSFLSRDELLQVIRTLPIGYRTIFNLYAIEGYTHREIGAMLGISENTSKSQLSRARNAIREILTKQMKIEQNGRVSSNR
jgi:RNA polymerase sigma-70 factor (ECF subfamily)